MGLYISEGCWNDSWSSFAKWRKAIAKIINIDLEQMEGFGADPGIPWSSLPPDPLHVLLNHPDYEGEIGVDDCRLILQRLKDIYPLLPLEAEHNVGSVRARTKKFIRELSRAVRNNKLIVFL